MEELNKLYENILHRRIIVAVGIFKHHRISWGIHQWHDKKDTKDTYLKAWKKWSYSYSYSKCQHLLGFYQKNIMEAVLM